MTITTMTPAKTKSSEKQSKMKKHITEQPITLRNWPQHLNWLHVSLLVFVPLLGLTGAIFTPMQRKTMLWAIVYYFMTGLGITAGYHRLWAHRSYTASLPLKIMLAAIGGGAVEGSIRWWSRDHRAHHRFTDTEKDPYSVNKGLVYAHLGWMILKQNPKRLGRTDISDLNSDKVVVWQHRNYLLVLVVMGFLFPTFVAGYGWGDWAGGFFYAGILRLCFVHHATFCVNSLAHWLGEQSFDDRHSPRDHVITAFVTMGEGWHNFHHTYPNDYRNGIFWYQYDPTKWLIIACKRLGLATDLKAFSDNTIEQARLQMTARRLDAWRNRLDWGVPIAKLPRWSFDEFSRMAKERPLVMVGGIVHDVGEFQAQHPGGVTLIRSGVGKDMTAAFNGGVYDHSSSAHNILAGLRVAVVEGGMEVEAWKVPAINDIPHVAPAN